jgi:YHS domain-containing protein
MSNATDATTAVDPICGMTVNPARAAGTATHRRTTYYFCSEGCIKKFKDNPERFLKDDAPAAGKEQGTYTCPMHPEVRQDGPGACPKCSMAKFGAGPSVDFSTVQFFDYKFTAALMEDELSDFLRARRNMLKRYVREICPSAMR